MRDAPRFVDYCELVLATIAGVAGLVVVVSNVATQVFGHGFVGLDGLPLLARWGVAFAFGAYAEVILVRWQSKGTAA